MASSIAMQMMGGTCKMMASQPGEDSMHSAPFLHQHTQDTQPAADQNQAAETDEQQNPSCNNFGVCHFACIVYLATVAIEVKKDQSFVQSYTPFSSQFQSITSIPLDPPPLARV